MPNFMTVERSCPDRCRVEARELPRRLSTLRLLRLINGNGDLRAAIVRALDFDHTIVYLGNLVLARGKNRLPLRRSIRSIAIDVPRFGSRHRHLAAKVYRTFTKRRIDR